MRWAKGGGMKLGGGGGAGGWEIPQDLWGNKSRYGQIYFTGVCMWYLFVFLCSFIIFSVSFGFIYSYINEKLQQCAVKVSFVNFQGFQESITRNQFPGSWKVYKFGLWARGYSARHDFNLTWLEEEGNVSEGGVARLIRSGFKKGCVFLYCLLRFWIRDYSHCFWNGIGPAKMSCTEHVIWEFPILKRLAIATISKRSETKLR
jgi:hypothetical protein